jgi:hypothetical protein
MKNRYALASVCLLIVLASGCFGAGNRPGSTSSTSSYSFTNDPNCKFNVCPAHPESQNYKTPLAEFGLHEINEDDAHEFSVDIEGDLVAWAWQDEQNRSTSGTFVGHVAVYNITTGKIVSVEDEPYYHNTLVHINHGRILFTRLPEGGAPEGPGASHLVLWDSKTNQKRPLTTGMDGTVEAYGGFDGNWLSFWTSHNTNSSKDGVWLLNIDTGQTIQLFHRPTREQYESGQAWAPSKDSAVKNGYAYYKIGRAQPNGTGSDDNQIVQYRISDGTTRLLLNSTEPPAEMVVGERYVAWGTASFGPLTDFRIRVYDLLNDTSWIVTTPDEGAAGSPHVGGDWLTYTRYNGVLPKGLVLVHLPTGTKQLLLDFSKGFDCTEAALDGHRFVVDGYRNFRPGLDSMGHDVYWGTLPRTPP